MNPTQAIPYQNLGQTGIRVPAVVFGTSSLGNLFQRVPDETKREIIQQWFASMPHEIVADSAGKYGAGLALEVMGREFASGGIDPDRIVISNKLGWRRAPLAGDEPTFEPGAWVDLEYDAVQDIGYEGILHCWEEGCELLGAYRPALVSVHDPDEYLASATSEAERDARWQDIRDAYRALFELKRQGLVRAVGVGAKDWTVIRALVDEHPLDWVMLANSLTLFNHPPELIDFVETLFGSGVGIINSAVFHSGFLTGGAMFDYQAVTEATARGRELLAWRTRFEDICREHRVLPAHACVRFALSPPGVQSIALSSSQPQRVTDNVAAVTSEIPPSFWNALRDNQLISTNYPYLD